jgi:branched-chain amino acid transport system substrate-binding protein
MNIIFRFFGFVHFFATKAMAMAALLLLGLSGWAAAQDIVLGQTMAPSSPLVSALSLDYNAGIQVAFSRANSLGGVQGRKIKLVTRDDGFDAKRTIPLVEELVEQENVLALVGVMGTQPTLKLADDKVLDRHHLAIFGPMTGLRSALTKPNVFPMRGSYEDEVRAMLMHSARLGRRTVLYLYFESGVGPQLAKLVPGMAQEAKVNLAGVVGFPVTADLALQQAAVQKVLDGVTSTPDAVVLLAVGAVHSEAVKVLRKRFGLGKPIYSLGQVNYTELIKNVGESLAWGVTLSQVMPMTNSISLEVVRDFAKDMQRYAPQAPLNYMTLEGYICGRITVEILKRAKTLTREGVLQAAEHAGRIDVGGFRVEYEADGRRSVNPIELTMVSRTGRLIH